MVCRPSAQRFTPFQILIKQLRDCGGSGAVAKTFNAFPA